MRILNLIVKQEWLDKILSGEKTVETRNITPTTASKYIYYQDETGKVYKRYEDVPEDILPEAVPYQYDAIRFFAGYRKDRKSALVEVKGCKIYTLTDDNGEEIIYMEDGNEYVAAQIDYSLGKIFEK